MSYDIYLLDPVTKEVLESESPHQMKGGTYAVGGTCEMWLNVTYNYGKFYYEVMDKEDGIKVIFGKTGAESIEILKSAIGKLGDDVDDDYWKATEGNAKKALCGLLAMAQMRPDGVWDGS